jgi:hypothetical protein
VFYENRQAMSSQQLDNPLQVFSGSYHDRPSKGFTWVGQTVVRLRLNPGEARVLPLRACFVSGGVYDLSCLRVSAAVPSLDSCTTVDKDTDMVVQRALSASLIILTQCNSKS